MSILMIKENNKSRKGIIMKLKKTTVAVRHALRGCALSHNQFERAVELNALKILIIYHLNGLAK